MTHSACKCGAPVKAKWSRCADCQRAYIAEWSQRNPEACQRYKDSARLRKYGLTADEYAALTVNGEVCSICGTDEPGFGKRSKMAIDHDHETKRVRGLLCNACNLMIGHAGDDPNRLLQASLYLMRAEDAALAEV